MPNPCFFMKSFTSGLDFLKQKKNKSEELFFVCFKPDFLIRFIHTQYINRCLRHVTAPNAQQSRSSRIIRFRYFETKFNHDLKQSQ